MCLIADFAVPKWKTKSPRQAGFCYLFAYNKSYTGCLSIVCSRWRRILLRRYPSVTLLSNRLLGVIRQFLCLRQQIQRLLNHRIGFRVDFQAFLLAELVNEELRLDVGTDPIVVLGQVGFGELYLLSIQELTEFLHHP